MHQEKSGTSGHPDIPIPFCAAQQHMQMKKAAKASFPRCINFRAAQQHPPEKRCQTSIHSNKNPLFSARYY